MNINTETVWVWARPSQNPRTQTNPASHQQQAACLAWPGRLGCCAPLFFVWRHGEGRVGGATAAGDGSGDGSSVWRCCCGSASEQNPPLGAAPCRSVSCQPPSQHVGERTDGRTDGATNRREIRRPGRREGGKARACVACVCVCASVWMSFYAALL